MSITLLPALSDMKLKVRKQSPIDSEDHRKKMCIYNHCNLEIYTNFAINDFFCKECNSKMQQKHDMGDLPRLLALIKS